jgi:phytoene/squalene synthetase
MSEANWRELEAWVARADADRYVAALFVSPQRRRGLIALYAFNHEVARIREIVHEPMVGHIRLGWWREQVAAVYEGRPVTAPLSLALQEVTQTFALPRALFDEYIDARGLDFEEAPFADEAALETYAAATAGSLMQLATRVCGAEARADAAAREAAVATAYAGFLRSLAFDAVQRRCRIPLDALQSAGLSAEDVFVNPANPKLTAPIARMATSARGHLAVARKHGFTTSAIAALAPAGLTEAYLRRVTSRGRSADMSQAERVARIAFSVLTWRI